MRRAAAGLLAIALLAVAVSAGPASAECVVTKHSKQVTKKVKRHGKVRRMKRTKHWFTCEPVAPAVPATPAPPAAPTPTPPPAEEEPTGTALGVKAVEYSYTLSRSEVPAGKVTVQLQNFGEDPHNLDIAPAGEEAHPEKISTVVPGSQKTATYELPEGTYRLWCDLEGHDEKGMHAVLVVGGG